jgi:hypothetical protein
MSLQVLDLEFCLLEHSQPSDVIGSAGLWSATWDAAYDADYDADYIATHGKVGGRISSAIGAGVAGAIAVKGTTYASVSIRAIAQA